MWIFFFIEVYGIGFEHVPHEFGSEEFSAIGTDEQVLYPVDGSSISAQMIAHCNLGTESER